MLGTAKFNCVPVKCFYVLPQLRACFAPAIFQEDFDGKEFPYDKQAPEELIRHDHAVENSGTIFWA